LLGSVSIEPAKAQFAELILTAVMAASHDGADGQTGTRDLPLAVSNTGPIAKVSGEFVI
jgi:hypothetical protein